jgi:hypothetical protein
VSVTLKLSYGDWVLLSDGTLQTAEGAEKCAQDIGEGYKNNRDPKDPSWYNGSELYRLDANPVLYANSGLTAELLIRKMLEESLLRLMSLQQDDAYCDDAERISYLKTLSVLRVGASSYAFYSVTITDTDEEIQQNYSMNLLPQPPAGMARSIQGGLALVSGGKKTFL